MDNTWPSELQCTEEELSASEVEALLLHLNERKLLVLERIGRINNAIRMSQNPQHAYRNGFSTVKQNRSYRWKWSEVVSGNTKQHPADRTPPAGILHHQTQEPVESCDMNTIPTVVGGWISVKKGNKVKKSQTS